MMIEIREPDKKELNDVRLGEVFEYDGKYYMRTNWTDAIGNRMYVNLSTGCMLVIKDNWTLVTPVNAKLVIE